MNVATLITKEIFSKTQTEIYKVERLHKYDYHTLGENFKYIKDCWKNNEKETDEIKVVYNHYLGRRIDIMKSTELSHHEFFSDALQNIFRLSKKLNLNNF